MDSAAMSFDEIIKEKKITKKGFSSLFAISYNNGHLLGTLYETHF